MRNSIVVCFLEQNFDLSFFSAQGCSTWSDDISSLSRIGILIGKAEYYFQDLPSDSKTTGYGGVEEVGLTADFAAYDAIFRQTSTTWILDIFLAVLFD